jgi:hypothetical protein
MRRVDAHVHAFPDRLATAVRERLGANGRLAGGFLLQDVAQSVRDAGFDRAWVLPYAHRAGVAESVNEWSAREVSRFPWLVAGATFHPGDEELPRLVERALVELRLRVVKLHCSVGAFVPTDPRLTPLWETAAARSVPIVIHAGRESPGETSAPEVEDLAPVLAAYPDLRIVLAHAGHPNTAAALALMERFDNFYADLTPVWDRAIAVGPSDLARFARRFLFGSDAPNNPVDAAAQAEQFSQVPLPAADLALLMGGAADCLVD